MVVNNYFWAYFVKNTTKAKMKYTEDEIVRMIEFLVDNIFVEFGGKIFQQTVGIPMGTNCAPLLADLFFFSYQTEFIEGLIRIGNKNLAKSFNFSFRYIDDVLSLNNKTFDDHVDRIYPLNLKSRTLQTLLHQPLTSIFTCNMTNTVTLPLNYMISATISIFLSWTFPFLIVTSLLPPPTVFTCRSWYDIQGLVPTITISVIDVVCWQTNLPMKVSKVAGWWWLWVSFIVAIRISLGNTSRILGNTQFPCAIWELTYSNM